MNGNYNRLAKLLKRIRDTIEAKKCAVSQTRTKNSVVHLFCI